MRTYYAPSIKSLSHQNIRLECDPALVRAIWRAQGLTELRTVYPAAARIIERQRFPDLASAKMESLNHAAGFHGVECLGYHKRQCRHVFYLNAGDPYAPTLIFIGDRMTVGCWGDLVESGVIDE